MRKVWGFFWWTVWGLTRLALVLLWLVIIQATNDGNALVVCLIGLVLIGLRRDRLAKQHTDQQILGNLDSLRRHAFGLPPKETSDAEMDEDIRQKVATAIELIALPIAALVLLVVIAGLVL
jgi:hypothetical protein